MLHCHIFPVAGNVLTLKCVGKMQEKKSWQQTTYLVNPWMHFSKQNFTTYDSDSQEKPSKYRFEFCSKRLKNSQNNFF